LQVLPGTKFVVTHDRLDIAELCDREIALKQSELRHIDGITRTTIVR
jgi:ABC-type polysaccharide/polyol phosphate transport system ATPase subunit